MCAPMIPIIVIRLWKNKLITKTEMEGFEPSRRDYRPAAFRERSLQPLGYISKIRYILLYTKSK